MKTIILFPGLAADETIFSGLHLTGYSIHVANFLEPVDHETLPSYAKRMSQTLPPAGDFIFIGVSFGGILAQEVARFMIPEKIILISSISSCKQKPFYFLAAKIFPVYRLLTDALLRRTILNIARMWTKKNEEERILFERMVKAASLNLIRWGIHQTLFWKPEMNTIRVVHIHGNKDMVFPIRHIHADYVIEGGEHFMIVQRAAAINKLLIKIIRSDAN